MACNNKKPEKYKYIIIGGGIAGVTCAETISYLNPESSVLLITASPVVKAVTNFRQVAKVLEDFDVEEKPTSYLENLCPNVRVIHAYVSSLETKNKEIQASNDGTYKYDYLCLCTGGTPKIIAEDSPFVLGIRDTETVKTFQDKLIKARRIIVVGNGGIATEMVYEIEGCEIIWAIKDESISSTFVDAGAATFFLPHLSSAKRQEESQSVSKRMKYTLQENAVEIQGSATGSALGPDWAVGLNLKGISKEVSNHTVVEYKVEVESLLSPIDVKSDEVCTPPSPLGQDVEHWPVYVKLTNGKVYGCDFVVSATGVSPNTSICEKEKFSLGEDGGIKVNDKMQTSVEDVYAAGDICTCDWPPAQHWFQMRLWTQARQMGAYAAKCVVAASAGEDILMDFCFELFAHSTRFFNYKVILLGKFNGQDLGEGVELLLRVTKGEEYVKAVMKDGRMHGAILIGETDLEETFENLILNQLDLSRFGEDLLNPNIDIEDYFD